MKPAGLTSENWLGNNLLLEQLHIKLSKIQPVHQRGQRQKNSCNYLWTEYMDHF